ncbi:hypothetical protein RJT34_20347 [Clitoria ternatea]|uniref:Uncharacterized protein n=1 Tax=Clitoria ternatea TaxID=43366 RepID=A0AAN9IT01_CLITE
MAALPVTISKMASDLDLTIEKGVNFRAMRKWVWIKSQALLGGNVGFQKRQRLEDEGEDCRGRWVPKLPVNRGRRRIGEGTKGQKQRPERESKFD